MALTCITYSEAYEFCTSSELKNMTTIVALRTPKEDKELPKIVPIRCSHIRARSDLVIYLSTRVERLSRGPIS